NPFTDVPVGHWAYDAVSQLAARGVISRYPDGAFKGGQPATRYEVASVVARAIATIDKDKATVQDIEMLKKLTMEFKDELDALGVKVDKIDKRIAVLEDNFGGWKLNGTLMFEAVFADKADGGYINGEHVSKSNKQFRKEQFYLYLSKQIDENTSFFAEYLNGADDTRNEEGGMGDLGKGALVREVYVNTKLPYDIKFKFGRFKDEYGLFNDDEPMFGHFYLDGFKLAKTFGNLTATGIIGRNSTGSYNGAEEDELGFDTSTEHMNYILNLHYEPSEKFFAGL
ncbi:MAG: S-layer homology domain-containing protein, partial [Synergistaceae bacterium]